MKKAKFIIDTTSESILAFVLLGIIATSFVVTNNLGNISVKSVVNKEVLGISSYSEIFNPAYFSDDFITIKDANLDVGGESLNVKMNSRKGEETKKLITVYNTEDYTMSISIVLDFLSIDKNANYYLVVNDKEQLIKDTFKPDQSSLSIEIDPGKETQVYVKVKSMERINTEFNVIFSEN